MIYIFYIFIFMKLVCGIPTKNEEWIIGKTFEILIKIL